MPTQIGDNRAKKMLKANELVLCMGVNQLRTPNIAMIAAACGFDAVYIDLEQNPTSLETAAGVCVAALGMGITPIARVTSHDPHDATRILDCGAQGVMVPHVQNAAEAKSIVEACLYAPKGHRSAFGSGPQLGYAAIPQAEVCKVLNEQTLLMAMIETPEALENADSIAAVDGIDVLHIGASDLSTEMGHPRAIHARADARRIRDRCSCGEGPRQGDGSRRRTPGFRVSELAIAAWRALPDRRLGRRLHPQRRPRRCEAVARARAVGTRTGRLVIPFAYSAAASSGVSRVLMNSTR
jgi:4-hydroxy-2-oxoheptanedioate aldolase